MAGKLWHFLESQASKTVACGVKRGKGVYFITFPADFRKAARPCPECLVMVEKPYQDLKDSIKKHGVLSSLDYEDLRSLALKQVIADLMPAPGQEEFQRLAGLVKAVFDGYHPVGGLVDQMVTYHHEAIVHQALGKVRQVIEELL